MSDYTLDNSAYERLRAENERLRAALQEVYDGLLWLDILFNTSGTVLQRHRELIAMIADRLGMLDADGNLKGHENE